MNENSHVSLHSEKKECPNRQGRFSINTIHLFYLIRDENVCVCLLIWFIGTGLSERIILSFTHPSGRSNLYDLLSSVELKRRWTECSHSSFRRG